MQSILQYRRFEKRLREQIDRHGVDAASGAKPSEGDLEKDDFDTSQSANDLEAGPPSTAQVQDHPLQEKDAERGTEFKGPIKSRPDGTQHRDTAPMDEDLSGSTTRSSASSTLTEDTPAPQLSTATTRETIGTRLGQTLTGVNIRSRKTNEGGHEQGKVFVVGFSGADDPMNPHNWPFAKRLATTILIAFIGLIVGFASSVDSAALDEAGKEFHVGEVVESLATGLYLVGFGFGAFFAAPISETVGRNPVYMTTMVLFMIFVMASGLSPNIGAQLAFRFIAGFFGSTPLTCAGGSISDMWTPTERTAIFPVFANSAFWGPILGPVIGGFIGQAAKDGIISWRWTEWVTLIWAGLIFFMMVFFMPETYAPTLMKWKASHLRKITGDQRYMSDLEVQSTKFTTRLLHNCYRPFLLFAFEPIVVLLTLYLTVVYIVLFTFLTGFEFIFTDVFGLSQGLTFLCFLGIGVGFFFASALVPWIYKRYVRALAEVEKNGGTKLPPEQRLIFAMIGAPFLPIGLFWMGWTAYPSVELWACLTATIPVGFAIMSIFISTYQYLIDAYESYAASALVGATFIRYIAAGGMVPVSIPMYINLNVHWTLTVLGAISLVMAPVPFVFFKFGRQIRKKSRYATDFGAS